MAIWPTGVGINRKGRVKMATAGKSKSPPKPKNLKERLKAGRLTTSDLKTITRLIEKTELAAKNLRAAIVE
jgi:hypothetical protein